MGILTLSTVLSKKLLIYMEKQNIWFLKIKNKKGKKEHFGTMAILHILEFQGCNEK